MRAHLAGLVVVVLMAACGSAVTAEPFEGVRGRAAAVADWLGVDPSTHPVETSESVPSCPDAGGVSATVEVEGLARVEMEALETFVSASFGDVAEASYFGGLGHPHGLAWVVFGDGSRLTVIDSYGTVNALFLMVFDCGSGAGALVR